MLKNSSILRFAVRALLPVVAFELFCFLFAFIEGYSRSWLPFIPMLLTSLLLPAYLAFIGTRFVSHNTGFSIALAMGVLFASVISGVFIYYVNWGISSGHFWRPDNESTGLFGEVFLIALVIALAPTAVAIMLRYRRFTHT